MPPKPKADWISRWLAITSLALSIVSLIYTARTFTVTHRAYVGIAKSNFRIEIDPVNKRRVARLEHIFTNTGSVPTWVKVLKSETTATTDAKTFVLPRPNVEGEGIYLLPGGPRGTAGAYFYDNEPISIDRVLSGATRLETMFAIEYETPCVLWWTTTRYYRTRLLLEHRATPPSFAQLSAEGN